MNSLWKKLMSLFVPAKQTTQAENQARALIKAIDAGGLPLNAARVNDIARRMGLDVSPRAQMGETIARIRKALQR